MASKIKVDQLETADGSGTIALQNQLSGMTTASLPTVTTDKLGTGSVLQVQSATWTGSVTTTSGTLAATGLSCSITPSSTSSKIVITVTGSDQTMSASDVGNLNSIYEKIGSGTATNLAGSGTNNAMQTCYENVGGTWLSMPICMQKLTTPNTTSECTYYYYFATRDNGNTSKVNMFGGETNMTLMEIAG